MNEKLSALISIVLCSVFGVCHVADAKTTSNEANDRALQKSIQRQGMASIPGVGFVTLSDPIYPGSNFTWSEATKGGSRIPIATTHNGIFYTAEEIAQNIIDFARTLDDIRIQFGNRPISINSWYRTPAANRAARGKPSSLHLIGFAADIRVSGISPIAVYARLSQSWGGGLGNDGAYTHVDIRDRLDWKSARWNYPN